MARKPRRETPTLEVVGHNTTAGERLRSGVERIERLHEGRNALAADIREVYAECRDLGFDTKAMQRVIRERGKRPEDREAEAGLFDTYWHAVHGDGPRAHARAREGAPDKQAESGNSGLRPSPPPRQVGDSVTGRDGEAAAGGEAVLPSDSGPSNPAPPAADQDDDGRQLRGDERERVDRTGEAATACDRPTTQRQDEGAQPAPPEGEGPSCLPTNPGTPAPDPFAIPPLLDRRNWKDGKPPPLEAAAQAPDVLDFLND